MTATFKFHVPFSRRLPDPVLGKKSKAERHIWLCRVQDIPDGLPLEGSNVRAQNINRRIYRDVGKHLRNEEGTNNTFHLKNKGITILAHRVVEIEKTVYEVVFKEPTQGIVDGGHTYKIIRENQAIAAAKAAERMLDPDDEFSQFVKIEILTGLDTALANEIARGLNTAVQVQEMSLANHANKFDWIKEELKDQPYRDKIAFREHDDGVTDIVDILRILELFNITLYPNKGPSHPIRAYTGKENVLNSYISNQKPLMRLRPILKDVLVLHDTVSNEAPKLWNEGPKKGKAGSLAFVEGPRKGKPFEEGIPSKSRPFEFPFIGQFGDKRLFRGALFPMLGAFRWMVVEDESGNVRWRTSFSEVLTLWRALAVKLMEATKETSDELGRKADAVGKSANHWKNLYNEVAFHQAVTMATGNGRV
ncbi:MAG TPA: AIPR family protein [Pirellulales bacterium]|nr:AIPR family protein [Pirellulales bacterium]